MLDKEFQYFLDHQDELVKKYKGKYIVIKGKKVIDYWDTFTDAYYNTQEQGHELGTFLIQECLPGEECYTTYFNRMNPVYIDNKLHNYTTDLTTQDLLREY